MSSLSSIMIPYDMYDTAQEFVVIMPLGGVRKDSIHLALGESEIIIKGEREKPLLKDGSRGVVETCYRGTFQQRVSIPGVINADQIRSELSTENILTIILPKMISPDEIVIHIR